MSYNSKVHLKQGGNELVIGAGATLTVDPGATVTGIGGGGPSAVAWGDVTGKPATFPPAIGATATTAKAGDWTPPDVTTTTKGLMLGTDKAKLDGIAAGATANTLALGATATTAAAGNHNHAVVADAATGLAAAANIQALAIALSARIKALEDAPA